MPYRPSFAGNSLGIGPALEALIPASILSAAIGVGCLASWFLLTIPREELNSPQAVLGGLILFGFALAIATIAAIFVVAFYLCVFGLPLAVLLGHRIGHPLALGISLLDAAAGALVATTGSKLGFLGADEFSAGAFAAVLCFALPAGYLYRRTIIALREQAEFA